MAYEWNSYFQHLKRDGGVQCLMKSLRSRNRNGRNKGENKMGMVYQSEEMQKEIDEMLTETGNVQLLSTEINATTILSLCARPLTFDVVLGGRNIVSLNNVENAITIYHAMMADFKGKIYHG